MCIHVLCTLFNPAGGTESTFPRAATFIDSLNHYIMYKMQVSGVRSRALGEPVVEVDETVTEEDSEQEASSKARPQEEYQLYFYLCIPFHCCSRIRIPH